MRRPRTFDTRLEALLDEATPEQLQRMHELSGFLLRREGKQAMLAALAPKRKKTAPSDRVTGDLLNA